MRLDYSTQSIEKLVLPGIIRGIVILRDLLPRLQTLFGFIVYPCRAPIAVVVDNTGTVVRALRITRFIHLDEAFEGIIGVLGDLSINIRMSQDISCTILVGTAFAQLDTSGRWIGFGNGVDVVG